jgi:hypothetical protein
MEEHLNTYFPVKMEEHLNTYFPDLNISVLCETENYVSVTGRRSGRYDLEKILHALDEWYPHVTSASWFSGSDHCLVFYYNGGNTLIGPPSGPNLMVSASGCFSMDNFGTINDLELHLFDLKHIFQIGSLSL